MGYKYCPKCELNRIPEDEDLCPICKKDLEQLKKITDSNKKLCPYCHEEYIPEDQDMCESCFEERLLTGVVDDSEIEEETLKEPEQEVFADDFVDVEDDILTGLSDDEIDLVDAPLEFDDIEHDDEILIDEDDVEDEDEKDINIDQDEDLGELSSEKSQKRKGKKSK